MPALISVVVSIVAYVSLSVYLAVDVHDAVNHNWSAAKTAGNVTKRMSVLFIVS